MKLIDILILELSRLPGVGKRSATRLAFHLLEKDNCSPLINIIQEARAKIHPCVQCNNLTEDQLCSICANTRRSARQICVVERVQDLIALENPQIFSGKYFVLGNILSPMKGIGPDKLPLEQLLKLFDDGQVEEVIMALNSGVESEATELYIQGFIQSKAPRVRVTQLARGLPAGGELEFLDRETIARALEERREA